MDSIHRGFITQPDSIFLSLPAEIRNIIYGFIFSVHPAITSATLDRPIIDCRSGSDRSKNVERRKLYPLTLPSTPAERKRSTDRPTAVLSLSPRHYTSTSGFCGCPRSRHRLDLLLICRQIYLEAETMFYASNHLQYSLNRLSGFSYGDRYPYSSKSFIESLSARRQQALKAVTISGLNISAVLKELTHSLLPSATNLHTLHIELPLNRFWTDPDADVIDWSVELRDALRFTNVKEIKVRNLIGFDPNPLWKTRAPWILEPMQYKRSWYNAKEMAEKIEGLLMGRLIG